MLNDASSLQGRLLLRVIGLVAGVWMLTIAFTWLDVRQELDELFDAHLAQAAALLVAQQVVAAEGAAREIDATILREYGARTAFQVFRNGRLLLRSGSAPMLPMAGPDPDFTNGVKTVRIENRTWRVFAAFSAKSNVQVYVGEREQSRAAILRAVLRSTLAPMLVALPLLATVAWWAVRQSLRPLRDMGQSLRERRPQALHPVVLHEAPTEMEPVIAALNSLFRRTGELMESERRFTADAAHELRTPIVAIRAHAQVAMGEADAGLRLHALDATLMGCDRAARLTDQLLTLSGLDSGAIPAMAPVDLGTLVRQVVADIATSALDKHQALSLDAGQECVLNGNSALLGALVRNLVDNAVRYSPPHATVRISVHKTRRQVQLSVQDSGPGMGDADRLRFGERFFRVLGSGQGGSGLGGSIVLRIAALHMGRVAVGPSAALGGLAVEVSCPLA